MKLRNKRTGEIGHFISTNWNETALIIMDNNGVQLAKYSSFAELNKEWEDALDEEPKEYWFITWCGDVDKETYDGVDVDKDCKAIGNCFESKEEAEQAVEKLKAFKRLKDKGLMFKHNKVIGEYGNVSYRLNYPANAIEQKDLDLLFGGEDEQSN